MTENFKILAQFVKDISSETPDIQSYIFVKENISKYQLNIDISSKALKNKMVEVNTTLKFEDKELNEKELLVKINENPKILKFLENAKIKKTIFVQNKLINLII